MIPYNKNKAPSEDGILDSIFNFNYILRIIRKKIKTNDWFERKYEE